MKSAIYMPGRYLALIGKYRQVLAVMLIFASVQGGILISQLLTTLYASKAQVGTIRALESALALSILGASLGMPALAVRAGAESTRVGNADNALLQLIVTGCAGGLIVWFGIYLASPLLERYGGTYLVAIAGLGMLTNVVRTMAGFVQGAGQQLRIAGPLVILTFLSIVGLAGTTYNWGVIGWVAGRYLGEGMVAAVLVYLLRNHILQRSFNFKTILPARQMLRDGITLNVALFIRLACDSLPFLLLIALLVPGDDVAYFGVAQLLFVAPNLIFAVACQVYLPILTRANLNGDDDTIILKKLFRVLAGAGIIFIAIVFFAWIVSAHVWPAYDRALKLTVIMAPALLLRAAALCLGNWMMATQNYVFTLHANFFELVLGGGLALLLIQYYESYGAGVAVSCFALCSASSHFFFWNRLRAR